MVKVARVRVNVIGQDGVGKTCLVRLLLGEEFKEQSSTCGIDFSKASVTMMKSHSSVAKGDTFNWRLLSHKEHKEILNLAYGGADRESGEQTEERKDASALLPSSSDLPEDDEVGEPPVDNPVKQRRLAQEYLDRIQEIVDDPTRIGSQSSVSLMTICDFGGQEPFLTAHAALMPSGALSMYMLVFNGAELLTDRAKSSYRQSAGGHIVSLNQMLCRMETNADFLKHWSSSVHIAHSPQLASKTEELDVEFPPIFLVATHRRKAEETRGTAVDVIQKNNDSIEDLFSGKKVQRHFIYPSMSDNNFFLVENETSGTNDEDPTASEIRGEVNKVSDSFWKNEEAQKARWLKFEDVLGELKSITKRSVSEIEEIKEVAEICFIYSESELKEALVHLTNVGAAFYFPEVSFLKKFVFHDTQWLVSVLASFVGSAHSKPKQAKPRTDWQKAKQSGHLSTYLVSYLLKQAEVKEHDYEAAKGILCHFDVLVEKEDEYFAPCFLENDFDGEAQCGKVFFSVQSSFPLPLVISAKDVLSFPEPLFFRLAARIIGKYFKKAPTNMLRNRLVFPLPVGGVNAEFLYLGTQNCVCLTVFSENERNRLSEAQLVTLRQRCSELRQWMITNVEDAKKRGMPGLQTEFYCQVKKREEGDELQDTLAPIEGFSADKDSWHLIDETKHVVGEELRHMKLWFSDAGTESSAGGSEPPPYEWERIVQQEIVFLKKNFVYSPRLKDILMEKKLLSPDDIEAIELIKPTNKRVDELIWRYLSKRGPGSLLKFIEALEEDNPPQLALAERLRSRLSKGAATTTAAVSVSAASVGAVASGRANEGERHGPAK